MKYLIYFLTCMVMVVFLISCMGNHQENNKNMETIYGEAQNTDRGAILVNKSGIFQVDNKTKWEEEYLSKRVKVTGVITYTKTNDNKGYNGHTDQMRTISIKEISLAK